MDNIDELEEDPTVLEKEAEDLKLDSEEFYEKHTEIKNQLEVAEIPQKYSEMKYFLDCGFNLLVFGVGSKRTILNSFAQQYLIHDPVYIINGFHTATNIKSVLTPLYKYVAT